MANLKKINIGGTSYDIVDAGGRELIKNINEVTIPALEEDIEEVGGKVTTLIGSDANMSARAIVQDEVAKQLESENISDSFDTLKEMAEYLSGHPNTVTEMNEAITKNADDIEAINDGLDTFMEGTVGESNGAGTIFAQLTSINSELESLGGGAGSIANQIKTEIEKLDAEVTSTGGTNVEVKVTEVDGKITAVAVTKDESYKKPTTGIGTSDLASGVVTSLGKADTAYQKPSTGIPTTDLTSAAQQELARLTAVTAGYSSKNTIGEAINAVSQSATQKAGTAETNAKAYTDTEAGKLQSQITAIANGTDNNFKAVEQRFENNEARIDTAEQELVTHGTKINRALTATKETFVYDSATETLTITSSAV